MSCRTRQPNGDGNGFCNHPRLRDLNLPPVVGGGRGGPLLTKTLLVSAVTASGPGQDDGPRLVARDKAIGEIVGSVDRPGGAIGTPMTYMHEMHEGRQFITLAVGGDVPELMPFALPDIETRSRSSPHQGRSGSHRTRSWLRPRAAAPATVSWHSMRGAWRPFVTTKR